MELYIHIPFCRSKCRYCDFASWAGCEQQMSAYVNAVIREAAMQADMLTDRRIETLFIGGGTPSLLPAELLKRLLQGVLSHFTLAPDAEMTTEANPGTLSAAWLDTAVSCGLNRLSLGMQAYQPELLRTLGRIHDFQQVAQSVQMARDAGIANINLDLMFGLPGQTPEMWAETLEAALSLHPEHLSCYGLIPEPGTPMFDQIERGELLLPDEDMERAMYDHALRFLAAQGFEQYEISNFSKPGYACRHNIGYWRQVPYLGLGTAAASMLPASWQTSDCAVAYWRITNPGTIPEYLHMIDSSAFSLRTVEAISPSDAAYETWMLGLRTMQGVSVKQYIARHGAEALAHYDARLRRLQADGLLACVNGYWRMTRRGMDIQNAILVELMDD